MNGIDRITNRILSEAETEAAAVVAEAEKSAAEVRAAWADKANKAAEELLAKGREETEQKVQRAERAARLEAKKEILGLKQGMVSAAYDRAKAMILGLPRDEYAAFLAGQAAGAALSGCEEVILNPKDRAEVGETVVAEANRRLKDKGLPGELKLSEATRNMSGGVALKEGAVEVNCTLESLLELSRGALDAEVAGILFR